jgi:hypothetical protein
MKQYFFDNTDQSLYVFNGETNELRVLPRLRVRVIIGLTEPDEAEETPSVKQKRTVTCRTCGQTGHTSRKCPTS